jgi:hypothetical protein
MRCGSFPSREEKGDVESGARPDNNVRQCYLVILILPEQQPRKIDKRSHQLVNGPTLMGQRHMVGCIVAYGTQRIRLLNEQHHHTICG